MFVVVAGGLVSSKANFAVILSVAERITACFGIGFPVAVAPNCLFAA